MVVMRHPPHYIHNPDTYKMGVCKLEFKDNALIVHLRRPELLIGKKGETIKRLKLWLGWEIKIVHVKDL